jgi:hypothetical protein
MDSSLKQHMVNLKAKLHKINYPNKVKTEDLASGHPMVFLPIINYVLMDYSHEMAKIIVENGFDLYAKKDMSFMKNVYQLLLKMFNYKPALTVDQFFREGYNEHKMILATNIIDYTNKVIKGASKPKKKVTNQSSSFSKRSTSLKPRKLDMQHSNNENLQILGDHVDASKSKNPYANPAYEVHNGLGEMKSVNQSYCVAPRPPKHDKAHMMATHDNKLSLTKENLDPNMVLNPSEFLDTNIIHPSSQTYHVNPYRPGSARGPMFEFNNSVPHNNTTQTKKMIKERNRKHRKSNNKSRQNADTSINNYSNFDRKPSQDVIDSEIIHSETTAIHVSQNEYNEVPRPEIMHANHHSNEVGHVSTRQLHSPGFGQPEEAPVAQFLPDHLQNFQNKYVKPESKPDPVVSNHVSRFEFDKLAKQNKELKTMINSLSESFSMLTKEYSKNMDAMKTTYTNLYSKHTLLENKVKYLERRMYEPNDN